VVLFQIAEIKTPQKLELYKPKLDKTQMYIRILKLMSVNYMKILKLFSSTSSVQGKFFRMNKSREVLSVNKKLNEFHILNITEYVKMGIRWSYFSLILIFIKI
jgi:hypothetical protein